MGQETEIAWTGTPRADGTIAPGATFNPWWGCFKVSPGCANCYADTFARRVGLKVWGPQADHRRFGAKHWNEPRKWNADAAKAGVRRRVFCASMADVFEGRLEDDEDRARLFALIEATPALDWLLLTKRPENMTRLAPASWAKAWPRNVWAGCTVENQEAADRRVPEVLRVPAAVRFLSVEPMLEAIDLRAMGVPHSATLSGRAISQKLDWIIVGGESGHGARPMRLEWAAALSEQCRVAGVPYFFKQGGAHVIHGGRALLHDRKGGDVDELACLFSDLAAAGVFRREWPEVSR